MTDQPGNAGDLDIESLVAAGLYDPAAPSAPDRLDLLQYLAAEGVTIDEMVAGAEGDFLHSLVADRRTRLGERSAADLAAATGLHEHQVVEAYRLLGIAVPDAAVARFSREEQRLMEILRLAWAALPAGMAEEILRSMGAALTLVAETAVASFVGSFEDDLVAVSELARAQITTVTNELDLELASLLGPLYRHHLWIAIERQRAAMRASANRQESNVTIGFVDLVGYTAATVQMDSTELLTFIQAFQRRTFDVVSMAGGRVVKHIGDEIMFACNDPAGGCAIALDLVEAFDDARSLPRGGLAHGSVVARHGDYYGAVVNLAARLADIAVPGEVLADAALADIVGAPEIAFAAAGRRQLKGFVDPVPVTSVSRHDR